MLLLDNNDSDDVEVQEAKQLIFSRLKSISKTAVQFSSQPKTPRR